MIIKYKRLLITSCLSISLCAMEKNNNELTTQTQNSTASKILNIFNLNQNLNIPNAHDIFIQKMHKTATKLLNDFNPEKKTCNENLSLFLDSIHEAKNNNVKIKEIGLFAFTQDEMFKNKLGTFTNPPYTGPMYTTVFFKHISRYFKNLEKNQFISPTIIHLREYNIQQKLILTRNAAIAINLDINLPKINSKKNLYQEIPKNVALEEFKELVKNIALMHQIHPKTITTMATIFYGPKKSSEYFNF